MTITAELHDGTLLEFPDGTDQAVIQRTVKSMLSGQQPAQAEAPSFASRVGQQAKNIAAGAVRGAGSIGATLLAPIDAAARAVGVQNDFIGRTDRREAMDAALKEAGADTDSFAYGAGKLGAEIAGTAGAGGAVARGLSAIPGAARVAPSLLNAVRTAGMEAGAGSGVGNALTRAAGGAINGGISAGLVDPKDATAGAVTGGALPVALKVAGTAGSAIGRAIRGAAPSPEVQRLAQRAEQLGIDIPIDRLADSKPLNALAASLNYVPFSGRAATEARMEAQVNRAASRLIGEDTSNMTQALRDAGRNLGAKFDATLKATDVQMTPAFRQALADVENKATAELSAEQAAIIHRQIAQIQAKGATGVIDGQTAYNIKKTLDSMGARNSNEAFYARDLRRSLMDALNDSLGPQQASEFAALRRQYGNMLTLDKLAANGADGEVSVARLANLRGIKNQDLQELADISAQFVKPRESAHGAAQRVTLGSLAGAATGALGGVPAIAGGIAAGRGANAALNSATARDLVLGRTPNAFKALANSRARSLAYRSAPVLAGDQ